MEQEIVGDMKEKILNQIDSQFDTNESAVEEIYVSDCIYCNSTKQVYVLKGEEYTQPEFMICEKCLKKVCDKVLNIE